MPYLVVGIYVACLAAAWLAPAELRGLLAKEGPVEQLSHALLVAAGVAFAVASRRRDPPAWPFVAASVLCAVLLLEELDWGGVYGITAIADGIEAAVGHPNFHNGVAGGSYILFGLPVALVYVPPLVGRSTPLPTPRDHSVAVAIIVGTALMSPLVPVWESALDELSETLLYAVLLATARSGLSTST